MTLGHSWFQRDIAQCYFSNFQDRNSEATVGEWLKSGESIFEILGKCQCKFKSKFKSQCKLKNFLLFSTPLILTNSW